MPSETAVLAALTHFTQPTQVKWIADLARLAGRQAETALDDLADRALLVSDPTSQTFYLPPLAAKFPSDKRPEAVAQTGDRLADRAYAIALENGYQNHERFPILEAEWPLVAAALPRLILGKNAPLQELCSSLEFFLDFSGRWDERLRIEQQAEEKAVAANDSYSAGWRAIQMGWVHYSRGQAPDVLASAARAEAYWKQANAGVREQATAIRLRGIGLYLEKNYTEAIAASRQVLDLDRTIAAESADVAIDMNDIASSEHLSGDCVAAERDYRGALRMAKTLGHREGVADITGNLAELALGREDWPSAEQLARDALAVLRFGSGEGDVEGV